MTWGLQTPSQRRQPRSPGPGRFPFLAAVSAVILATTMVLAERPHVVIVGPALDHAAVVRMRGELAMLGIDVDVVVQARDAGNLEALARRLGAAAALRVETAPPAIVLWVDPAAAVASGPSPGSAAEVRIAGPAEERDPGLLALRAVEVLRARLIKVPVSALPDAGVATGAVELPGSAREGGPPVPADDAGVAPAPEPPRAPPDAGPPAPPASSARDGAPPVRSHPLGFSAAPAVLVSPGGVPAAFHVRVGAEWDPIPRLGVEAMAFLPVTAGSVTADEGSIDLRVFGLGGGLKAVVTDPAADFSVALGLGVDAMMLSFSGKAEAPWSGESGSRWAVAPYAAATAAYRFHPRFSLRLDMVTLLVRPEPVLRLAGRDVASFGLPAVIPSLGVEVRP